MTGAEGEEPENKNQMDNVIDIRWVAAMAIVARDDGGVAIVARDDGGDGDNGAGLWWDGDSGVGGL